MSFWQQLKCLFRRKEASPDYIQLVSEKTGWSYDEAKKQMDIVRTQLGIPYDIYYEKEYYAVSRSRQERRAATYNRFKESEAAVLNSITKKTGKSSEEIIRAINRINSKSESKYKVKVLNYNRYGMYDMSEEDALDLVRLLGRVRRRTSIIQKKLLRVDAGELDYASIENDVKRYYKVIKKTITPVLSQKLTSFIEDFDKEVINQPKKLKELITDIEVSKTLLGFTLGEYKMYHLSKASFEEKREYLNDRDRKKWIREINSTDTFDLVNNKYLLYGKLKELFARDMFAVNSEEDFDGFCEFVSKHPTFVCKPLNDSLGRGVSLVTIEPDADLESEFRNMLDEKRTFLLEERVVCDKRIAAFNPDSVNTVRLMIYYDGEKAYPAASFFRTGRAGSFVDNGGAGGIFVSVDLKTGKLNSIGGDENGRLYEEHPDSHIKYMGFQLPKWQEALDLGAKACETIGEKCFIGWDLALTDKGNWVIIEGNGIPQFLHQGPLGYGVKSDFRKLIGV